MSEETTNRPEDQDVEAIDERVQEVLDKFTEAKKEGKSDDDDLDDEKLFEELENDDSDIANLREKRMEQLKQEMEQLKEMQQHDHGSYVEVVNEKEILEITTSTKLCVVHFFHKEFRRCQIIDKHLKIIANKHFKTRFVKINVDNSPFLVDKLKIKILPCIIAFIDGISVDRIIGFEELGNTDSFTTAALEFRLSQSGVIKILESSKKPERKTIFGFEGKNDDDDDDDD